MCFRKCIPITGFTLLCSILAPVSVRAGAMAYEGIDGAECRVTTNKPPELIMEGGYNEFQGSNAMIGISIPLGNPTADASRNCVEFARQDQARQHFMWLLDMYENGVITRESLEAQAEALGMTLTPTATDDNLFTGTTVR